jgi:ribosomal protein S18 acetylase RimI-like enzyme
MILRPGRDDDAAAFIALIAACWAEYPNCPLDVDGENPELRRLASYFAEAGGALWAAETDGALAGMIGTLPRGEGDWEICKVYVAAAARGTGLADRLLHTAEQHAKGQGATRLHLWSDTKFDRAHRFYERHGFVRAGGIRALPDIARTLEFGYAKPAAGLVIQPLDIASAGSAARGLGRILVDCVATGASVSFLPPLPHATATAFYQARATDIARGHRILLAAWLNGQLAGSVMVDLAMPPNQPHRAEIQKLLVDPGVRRQGVARALMRAAEQAAQQAGRTLLVLDTREGDSAEPLYRSLGWTEVGVIPKFARNAEGGLDGTVIFFKQLAG